MTLVFLGTGASGGTPGRGRSRRLESAMLAREGRTRLLVDATRDFDAQAARIDGALAAVLLTHAHRDASGGLPRLARWQALTDGRSLPVLASAATIATARARHRRLWPLELEPLADGATVRLGAITVTATRVPHAREPRFPTQAFQLVGARTVVYASDVARLEARLRALARRADLVVIDGAMWGRPLFSHLRIDLALPELCRWPVGRIVLTQIGRTAPPHEQLERLVARLCPRARPAWDGLRLVVPRGW